MNNEQNINRGPAAAAPQPSPSPARPLPRPWNKEHVEKEILPKLAPALISISGPIGGLTFSTSRSGAISVTERQPECQPRPYPDNAKTMRFRRAVAYAKEALMDQSRLRDYKAAADSSGVPVFALAVQDYLTPPVIEYIGTTWYHGKKDQVIDVGVVNPAPVARVRVVIRTLKGKVLEQGWIKADESGKRSRYVARKNLRAGQTVQIQATATDFAGNVASLTTLHQLKVQPRQRRCAPGKRQVRQLPGRAWSPDI